MNVTERDRALMVSSGWGDKTEQEKYVDLMSIGDDASIYTVSYLSGDTDGTNYTKEDFPSLLEAEDRAIEIYAKGSLYAGSYIDVVDLGGESYMSMYVR